MQFPRCYLRCAMQNTNIGWTHRTKSSFGHWVMSSLGCNAFLCVVILQRTSGHVFQGTRVRPRMCMRVRTYACAHMCVWAYVRLDCCAMFNQFMVWRRISEGIRALLHSLAAIRRKSTCWCCEPYLLEETLSCWSTLASARVWGNLLTLGRYRYLLEHCGTFKPIIAHWGTS